MGKEVEGERGSVSLRAQGTHRSRVETQQTRGGAWRRRGDSWATLVTRVSL